MSLSLVFIHDDGVVNLQEVGERPSPFPLFCPADVRTDW